jgi:hypothetical protein
MNQGFDIVVQSVALIASIIFLLLPMDRSRSRAAWANALFVTVGIVGVFVSGTKLLLILHWIEPSISAVRTIGQARTLLCGFALGLILALIISGQLIGKKQIHYDTHQTTA